MAENFVSINPNALIVNAFLGGVSFTVLAILLQVSPTTFKIPNFLIPMTAISGILFLLATIGAMNATNSKDNAIHRSFYIFVRFLTTIGLGILLVVIPFSFIEYSITIFFIVFSVSMVGICMLAIFNVINNSKRI